MLLTSLYSYPIMFSLACYYRRKVKFLTTVFLCSGITVCTMFIDSRPIIGTWQWPLASLAFTCVQTWNIDSGRWVAPERIGMGAPDRPKAPEIFLWSCPSTFFALKVQLVVLVSAFVMVSTVWSISCLLFFYSRCPRAQPFVKVGGTCPPCPMESAPLILTYVYNLVKLSCLSVPVLALMANKDD